MRTSSPVYLKKSHWRIKQEQQLRNTAFKVLALITLALLVAFFNKDLNLNI